MKALLDWTRMIKIEHTLFSLPFVISSALLAIYYHGQAWQPMVFVWIGLALLGARSFGMTANRLYDAKIDALNPRTKDREIPAGKISEMQALIFGFLSLAIFIYAAWHLPTLCRQLVGIAITCLWFYPFLKRVTWFCHLFMGIILGGATLGAWIAITGNITTIAPVYLSLAVAFWVAGFDIIYSTLDTEFDREQKLHSIPAKFGKTNAIKVARFCHFLTPLFLYLCGQELGLGLWYKLGIVFTVGALYYEQQLVKENKIDKAFFTVNSWISVVICLFVILELFV